MDIPVNDLSQANELGWRVLAAETIFKSHGSDKNGAPSTIQFEVPVNICEIYVLSPSMYLRTSTGGFLLGGTEPKKFPITFHCNNVDEDSASANVKLGELNYEEKASISMKFSNEIWTNRLIVFAKYSTLTIVVYGTSRDPNAKVQKKTLSTLPPLGPKYMNGIYSFVLN
ncbi:uncharacterized protein LOC111032782 [Myzus persicae]|uniref:uncharacterized protein LOC111032782 n=1 Tax=Myzus persicae TaxID=13164 RepID=UPI000B931DF9|nr:uncharacterized protein LOC111032782 [Myzus persicae]